MNAIDVILVIPLAWGAVRGFKKGLVTEIASFAALGLGVWGAFKFSDVLGKYLKTAFNLEQNWIEFISFVVLFICIVLLVFMLGKFIQGILKKASLGFVNKLAGLLFGLMFFGFILSVVLFIFDRLDQHYSIMNKEYKESSLLYKPVASFAVVLVPGLNELTIDPDWEKIIPDDKKLNIELKDKEE